MERPTELGRLKTEEWDLLQEIADRFEAAWQKGESVDLASFLPPSGDPLRPVALQELIKSDLEIRWRRGQQVCLEDYLRRFPELGTSPTIPPRLVYEEYRVRQLYGDRLDLTSYRDRFPGQFGELQKLLQEQPLPTMSKGVPTPSSPSPPTPSPPVMTVGGGNILTGGGGYKLIRRIGTGGFGEVWLAEAPGGFKAAVKMLFRPLDHQEAQRELRALEVIRQVSHPFLLQTQQFWTHEERLYIVMELAEGSLRDRYKECRMQGLPGIPLVDLLRYFRESAEAIDYLHSEHVLHRDIKPDNILLLKGHAKVADFGLAREQQHPTVSVSGSGTPAYMAPEVWRGKASEPSDRYSLALAYAELRLGHRPFTSNDYMGVMMDHLEVAPELDPLPEAEQHVLRRALAKKPEERYASCREFVQALEEALAGSANALTSQESQVSGAGIESPPFPSADPNQTDVELLPPPPSPEPTRKRLPLAIGSLLAVMLLSMGAVGYLMFTRASSTSKRGNPSDGPFSFVSPAVLELYPGEEKTATIHIKRNRFTGTIELTFQDQPKFTTMMHPITLGEGGHDISVTIWAREEMPVGTYVIPIQATADGHADQTHLELKVIPLPEMVRLPGWRNGHKANVVTIDGKHYFSSIDLDKHGLHIPFVLVPRQHENDPPTFYMMENKVSNHLWKRFIKDNPDLANGEWRLGGRRDGEDIPVNGDEGQLPVLRLPVEAAHRFAVWLGGLLPTTRQWDAAAGYYQRGDRKGPSLESRGKMWPPGVGVNLIKFGPMAVGLAENDVSPFGARDMAGNGREFTRNLVGHQGKAVVPFPALQDDLVILRGRMYTLSRPLYYTDLDEQQEQPQTQYYHQASPYTSFRVVLEVP